MDKFIVESETDLICHKTAGLLNFLGGNFTQEKVENLPFKEVVKNLLCNGGELRVMLRNPNG